MSINISKFNIRVYGLLIVENQLLITDEIRKGMKMTKLPGGGLEFGEGIEECLKREWREELNVNIEVGEIFYVNPFLQQSAFNIQEQVISMYFQVKCNENIAISVKEKPMDFDIDEEDEQVFRWVSLTTLMADDFTFPIDQALVPKLKANYL